ncbi:hypothetical protein H4219_003877 [Mycoemilia scoparia]|uniref:Uncharacterized protein n=1 Tax=Mycoemilia scoparia TaxID=417184 RepID=A0A9W8DNN2_9FUNG|nr:hypothetical protein H4219_003877 [Mycoemilia scoparia]
MKEKLLGDVNKGEGSRHFLECQSINFKQDSIYDILRSLEIEKIYRNVYFREVFSKSNGVVCSSPLNLHNANSGSHQSERTTPTIPQATPISLRVDSGAFDVSISQNEGNHEIDISASESWVEPTPVLKQKKRPRSKESIAAHRDKSYRNSLSIEEAPNGPSCNSKRVKVDIAHNGASHMADSQRKEKETSKRESFEEHTPQDFDIDDLLADIEYEQ